MFRYSFVVLLALFSGDRLPAQAAVVEGIATGMEDSSVVAHALVRLQSRHDTGWVASQQRITNASGRFRFADVAPGSYRVQLLRIGYEPVSSELVRVAGSGTMRIDLRVPSRALMLAPMNVYATAACLSGSQLATDPRLLDLWQQARTGVETRRAFDRQYRYRRTLRQDVILERRVGGRGTQKNTASVINDPDSVAARDSRRQARHRTEGYASATNLTLPDEKEILNDDFLRSHCIETGIDEENGAFALSFRPLSRRRDIADVRGRLWIDATSYQVRRLEVEYLRDGKPFAEAAVGYVDVPVGGRAIRLPGPGTATLRPGGAAGVIVRRARSTFVYTYDQFEARN